MRNANTTTFKGLNSDWSNFGLKSKKAESSKQKPFQRADFSESFIFLRNLQSDIEDMLIRIYMKSSKDIKKQDVEAQKRQLKEVPKKSKPLKGQNMKAQKLEVLKMKALKIPQKHDYSQYFSL